MNRESMLPERSTAVLKGIPQERIYPVVVLVLLVGTAVALAFDQNWLGIAGVMLLSLLSLAWGAIRTPEELG
jgi:hypothetical protein